MFLDLVVCSFAGLLAFFICQSMGVDGWKSAVVISITAHEGTRAINLMIRFRDRALGIERSADERRP